MAGVRPKSLVLDVLRVAESRAIPVRAFVEIGSLFGLSGNAVRVSVTRLVSAGLVESDERGHYRLSEAAATLAAHVESWRDGEARMRPWNGEWLVIAPPKRGSRAERARTERALERLGYRAGFEGLWLRPDNLAEPFCATFDKLVALGLDPASESFIARGFATHRIDHFQRALWSTAALVRAQRELRVRLEKSLKKLDQMPLRAAASETFLLGGAAIRLLSTDPLLPSEIVSSAERARLTETMLRYDVIGRRIWRKLVGKVELDAAPAHLGAMELRATVSGAA